MRSKVLTLAMLTPLLWACEDASGPESPGEVTVRFQAAAGASAAVQPAGGAAFDHLPAAGAITLTGSNGTLVIQDIRLIVSELELERVEGACVAEQEDDDCEKFEGGPFLVDLLDGGTGEVVSAVVPGGAYTELEFEVENLDADEDDDASERQAMTAILASMREAYPAFPSEGSMVVHGTFEGTPFTVYFDAEIEVEEEFATPFRVPEDGVITVRLDPARWFMFGGQVLDPRPFNGQTLEFEGSFEHGVEVDHDD